MSPDVDQPHGTRRASASSNLDHGRILAGLTAGMLTFARRLECHLAPANLLTSMLYRAGLIDGDNLDRASDLNLARDACSDLYRDLNRSLDLVSIASGSVRDVNDVVARDINRARILARDLNHALVPGRVPDLKAIRFHAREIHALCVMVSQRIIQANNADRTPHTETSRTRMAAWAGRLAALAVWLLPARERARYGAEYRSELHDLAAAGADRRQQLAYAARLLVRAVPLRVAVLEPRRGKASP